MNILNKLLRFPLEVTENLNSIIFISKRQKDTQIYSNMQIEIVNTLNLKYGLKLSNKKVQVQIKFFTNTNPILNFPEKERGGKIFNSLYEASLPLMSNYTDTTRKENHTLTSLIITEAKICNKMVAN